MYRLIRIKNYLILLLLFICFSSFNVFALVKPTNDFYVNDYANILSNETEKYIVSKSSKLASVDGTQIVVVTVKNLEGYSLEDYATKLFREFGIGDKDKNNGLLLLLALEERKFRVEVGYGLEGILPDGKTGRFQDKYIIPYLKEDKWNEGIKNGYDAFYTEIVEQNNLDLSYSKPVEKNNSDSFSYVAASAFGLIVGVLTGSSLQVKFFRSKKSRKTLKKFGFISTIMGFLAFVLITIIFSSLVPLALIESEITAFFLFFIVGIFYALFSTGGGRYYGGGSSRGF